MTQSTFFGDCTYGLGLADEFIQLCQQNEDDSLLMEALIYKARFLECIDETDSTYLEFLEEAEMLCVKKPSLYGPYYEFLGNYHFFFDRLPKAIEYCLLAENAYKESGDVQRFEGLYNTFTSVYEAMSDFERALEYAMIVRPLVDETVDETWDEFYNTLGWIYYRNGEIDSALSAIRRSVLYHRKLTPGNPEIAYPIGNLALIFRQIGELDSAKIYSTQAVALFHKLNHELGVAEAFNNLGQVAMEEGKSDSAILYFEHALLMLEGGSDEYEEMISLEGLYKSLQERDPKRAIAYFQRFSELKINRLSKEETLKALQLEAEFYQDRNEDRIRQLKYESQLKSLEIEQQNNRFLLTSFALIIMVFVAGLIFFYWLQRKRMIRSLEESNEINQRIISLISHDFRGPLNNVKLTLELLQSSDIEMSEFMILSKDLYRQSSDLSLMFDSFVGWTISQRDGYVPAKIPFKWSDVVEEVISISQPLAKLKNIRIQLKAHSSVQLETDRMASSLILRNLISNAIKYSHHDSSIEIEYVQDKDEVQTTIRDHGIGISREKLHRIMTTGDGSQLGTNNEYGAGPGLRMVIKYVKGIGGTIEAESEEGKGTRFTITIPINLDRTH